MRRLVERCGAGGFDYRGDSRADIAVWRSSRHAYVVDDTGELAGAKPSEVQVKRVFSSEQRVRKWKAAIRAMRPHQWAKNLLIFVPLLAAHHLGDTPSLAIERSQPHVCSDGSE